MPLAGLPVTTDALFGFNLRGWFWRTRLTVVAPTPIFSAIAASDAEGSAATAFAAATLALTGMYPTPLPQAASASVPQPSQSGALRTLSSRQAAR